MPNLKNAFENLKCPRLTSAPLRPNRVHVRPDDDRQSRHFSVFPSLSIVSHINKTLNSTQVQPFLGLPSRPQAIPSPRYHYPLGLEILQHLAKILLSELGVVILWSVDDPERVGSDQAIHHHHLLDNPDFLRQSVFIQQR